MSIEDLVNRRAILLVLAERNVPAELAEKVKFLQKEFDDIRDLLEEANQQIEASKAKFTSRIAAIDSEIQEAIKDGEIPENQPAVAIEWKYKKEGQRQNVPIDDVRALLKTKQPQYRFLEGLISTTKTPPSLQFTLLPPHELAEKIGEDTIAAVKEMIDQEDNNVPF